MGAEGFTVEDTEDIDDVAAPSAPSSTCLGCVRGFNWMNRGSCGWLTDKFALILGHNSGESDGTATDFFSTDHLEKGEAGLHVDTCP